MSLLDLFLMLKGGAGSGNWGHAGIPGKRGGSQPRSTGMSLRTGRDWKVRQIEKKGLRGKPAENFIGTPDRPDDLKAYGSYTKGLRKPDFFDDGVPMWQSDVRGQVKDQLVTNISNATGIPYESVNSAIKQWADTSNDQTYKSLSMQEAASELFNSPLSDWQKEQLNDVKGLAKDYPYNPKGKPMFDGDDIGPYNSSKAATKAFLSEMYNQTQEEFKRAGVKTVTLYRGTTTDFPEGTNVGDTIGVKGNTLESWSLQKGVATGFGDNVISMEVPVERILSSARTGFGCLNEWEFVVIGGQNDQAKVEKKYVNPFG